jgi:vacuolar-type H+-ATPase subunit D/Vma8
VTVTGFKTEAAGEGVPSTIEYVRLEEEVAGTDEEAVAALVLMLVVGRRNKLEIASCNPLKRLEMNPRTESILSVKVIPVRKVSEVSESVTFVSDRLLADGIGCFLLECDMNGKKAKGY